ncbi:hypothetical protein EDC61_10648 [Sulfuritortus calidifontis]|uniref:Lipoprotein n=1 Tax=Sulfuritortus calidifontis TaxID=1914471 RepID=A0A4R3JYR5_9PROT|nr:hypothetical protein [Sulfuritortus calidifontis]TCS72134.1 hypothetical protein EDC61_10648 [Sulfuritortus calidifontis]
MKKLLLLGMTLLLASCANVSKVGPGEVAVKDQLTAKLDSAWNRVEFPSSGKSELWTTDGLTLDSLVFYVGVADGEPLAELAGRQDKQQARFRSAMPPHEIVELYGTVASEGGNSFKLDKLAPAAFLGNDGFRFDFTLLRKGDEVELKGVAYGAVRNGKLYLMTFRAPKLYYFNKHLGRVEAVARSLKLRG